MKRVICAFVLGAALMGCSSSSTSSSHPYLDSLSGFAGGNGVFGEDTLHPGARATPLKVAEAQPVNASVTAPVADSPKH